MCTCDAVPTRAPVTHNDDDAEDEKPAWIEDDDVVGYGTSSATSDILGDKAIREGGPGSCAVPEDNEDASWRQAWKKTRKGLKKMSKKGACALGPGPPIVFVVWDTRCGYQRRHFPEARLHRGGPPSSSRP